MRVIIIFAEAVLASIPFIEGVEITVKVISGLSAVVVAIFAVKYYRANTKFVRMQTEKLEKEKLNP